MHKNNHCFKICIPSGCDVLKILITQLIKKTIVKTRRPF